MAFDLAKFQQELSVPKKIINDAAGLMLLYEARLEYIERVRDEDGSSNNTVELWLKLVWWHNASSKPRASTIHSYASVLLHDELTDFAKIMNAFLPPDKQLDGMVDLVELVTLADSIVKSINTNEIFCYTMIDNKQKIGKKLKRFQLTEKTHPKLTRELCDSKPDLEWYIPEKHSNEKIYQELAKLNRERWKNGSMKGVL